MTSPFPFVAGAILDASELNAIGDATAFTPSWASGVTVGDAVQTAHYYEINDLIFMQVDLRLGSTSAITGDVRMDLPITAAGTFEQAANLTGFVYDASTALYYRAMGTAYSSTAVRIRYITQSGAAAAGVYGSALSSSVPITWVTGDGLIFATSYKRA